MDTLPGKIAFSVGLGVMLALLASAVVGWLYRRALVKLMMSPAATPQAARLRPAPARPRPALPASRAPGPTLDDNTAAHRRLVVFVVGLSVLMAGSGTAIEFPLIYDTALTPRRWLVGTLWSAWLVFPALAVLLRWSRLRLVAVLLAWYGLVAAVMMSQSGPQQQWSQVLLGLGGDIGVSMLLILAFALGGLTRTVGAWLLPFLIALVALSVAGLDGAGLLLLWPEALRWLFQWFSAHQVLLAAALLPWVLAWPLLRRLSRALEAAYIRQLFCELGWLMAAIWFIHHTVKVASALASQGAIAGVIYLPLLWLPLAFFGMRRWLAPRTAAPTLLVLRVFRRDDEVQALFDAVVDRWRLTGNTLMIAGTDLANRTLDPGELFAFLGGRVAEQFVADPAEIPGRLAALELRPDLDGRYRVNESFCRDSTWQPMLQALLDRSDVVLTDLRGFQARNEGCRWELRQLAAAPRVKRVVVLHDGATDRAVAELDMAGAPARRFTWLAAPVLDARVQRRVLAALLQDATAAEA